MPRSCASTASDWRVRRKRSSRRRRARDARRDLPHARARRRARSQGKFYVVVSRSFIAENDDVATVICAPVYSEVLGLSTEIVLGVEEGLPRASAARCDFLTLMFKTRLTHFVSSLSHAKVAELDRALANALELPVPA